MNDKPTYNLSGYPNLAGALSRLHKAASKRQGNCKPKLNDMFCSLGVLAGSIYEDQLALSAAAGGNYRAGLVETFVFEHDDNLVLFPFSDPRVTFPINTTPTVPETIDGVKIDHLRLSDADFASTQNCWLVGYDIETTSPDSAPAFNIKTKKFTKQTPQIVSHQWYFNFQGIRFGIILISQHRISQRNFVAFLDNAVPKIKDECTLKTVLVYSHFSVMESGWMHAGLRKVATPNAFNTLTRNVPIIPEMNECWTGYTVLRTVVTQTKRGHTNEHDISLMFCDSMKLQASTLKKLGENMRLPKIELPDGAISRMSEFLQENPRLFVEYAIIDSVICAEAHLFFFNVGQRIGVVGNKKMTRMTQYSGSFFSDLFKNHYGADWKQYLGYDADGQMTDICKMFIKFYHGGRNDVMCVGPQGAAHYHDLHSAYLTSVAMLKDIDFSKAVVARGSETETLIKKLMSDPQGPFQVAGVDCSFRFREGTYPVFPVRADDTEALPGTRKNFCVDGMIFPMTGSASVTWPEFYVAMKYDLLEQLVVHQVVTFETVDYTGELKQLVKPADGGDSDGRMGWFSSEIIELLIKRSTSGETEKLYLKNILNFFYGLTATGVSNAAANIKNHDLSANFTGSSVSCYPLAAYITGFCRATEGELLQFNKCFGVTTDAFISPIPLDQLVMPENGLCQRVQERLTKGGFTAKKFISTEASGNCSIFFKTRGYVIINTETLVDGKTPTPLQMIQKMACPGFQIDKFGNDPLKELLDKIFAGYGTKSFFMKLAKLRVEQQSDRNIVPVKRAVEGVKIDVSYDMKHRPLTIELREIVWSGRRYTIPSFETEPLYSALDFHFLRGIRRRDNRRDIARKWPGLNNWKFPTKPVESDGDLDLPLSPEWTRLDFDVVLPTVYLKDAIDNYFKDRLGLPVDYQYSMFLDDGGSTRQNGTFRNIDFNYSTHELAIIEMLRDMCVLPTYLGFDDYRDVMHRFACYLNGGTLPPELVVCGSEAAETGAGYYTVIEDTID